MLLWVVWPWSSSSVDLVNFRSGKHLDCILDGANGVADGAPCAVCLDNLRNSIKSVKSNGLVTGVCTGKVAATTLKAFILVNDWCKELVPVHLLEG